MLRRTDPKEDSMNLRPTAIALTLMSLFLVPLGAAADACVVPQQKALRFKPPVYIDQHRSGGEPVTIVAKDGSIIAGAHLGTTLFQPKTVPEADWFTQYGNQTYVWRSTDDGQTWKRIEIAPGVPLHTTPSTGLSDPDFAMDSAGNLYGTEINLANVAVFSSHDNGQTWPDGNPVADSGDRPWLTARGPNEVYLLISGNFQKSTDGGKTWVSRTNPNGAYGDITVDPSDPQGLLVGTNNGLMVSRDDGVTWETSSMEGGTNGASVMKSIGVDKEGYAYYGHIQSNEVRFSSWNPATGEWAPDVTIPRIGNPAAIPMWSWTASGDAGRAAVGWYERIKVASGQTAALDTYEVRVYVAVTENARGSSVTCPDGSVVEVPPQWSVADAAGRPIHVGQSPSSGTGSNVAGDRRLGDYFTINFDRLGRVFVMTGDTRLTNVHDTQYYVARPLFIPSDDDSPRLLAG
jgi:hypothetical protein